MILNTTEAESIPTVYALKTIGLPALALWEKLIGRSLCLDLKQDNQATMRVMLTGKYPSLRHGKRKHGISMKWLLEVLTSPSFNLTELCYYVNGN